MRRPVLAFLVAAAVVAACSSVGVTERKRIVWVPQSFETDMGVQAWQATLQESDVVTSGPEAQMVARIGADIAEAAKQHPDFAELAREFEWEFVLIESEQVNAWALPGGKSAVYTGLLEVAEDEDQLAAVMGHEVAHALARHGGERITQGLLVEMGLTVAQVASGDMSPEGQDMLMQALGVGSQAGILLPYSRTHESEADHIGLFLMAQAGYDPRAAVTLWQNMAAQGGDRPPELLSTHPSEGTRMQRLDELMPEALEIWRDSQQGGG